MTLVSPSQSNPGDEITAATINTPVNELAAVLNGAVDDTNVSSISGSKIANGSIAVAKLAADATPYFKVGTIGTATLGTTGTKTFTGLGFRPRILRVYIGYDTSAAGAARECLGVSDGTNTYVRGSAVSGSSQARWSISGTTLINIRTEANSTVLAATLTSLDADGFTINVSTADAAYSGYYEAVA